MFRWCAEAVLTNGVVSLQKLVSSVDWFNLECRKSVKVHSAAVAINFDHQLAERSETHTQTSCEGRNMQKSTVTGIQCDV